MGKILIMEDEPNHIFIVQHSLKRIGHEVFACSHPNNFMRVLEQTQPDLILMDINLPQVDGLTLIKKVRDRPEFANVPIIVLTAVPIDDIRKQATEKGSNIFLEKPMRIATLRRVVTEVIDAVPSKAQSAITTLNSEASNPSSGDIKLPSISLTDDKSANTPSSEVKKTEITTPKPTSLVAKK